MLESIIYRVFYDHPSEYGKYNALERLKQQRPSFQTHPGRRGSSISIKLRNHLKHKTWNERS